MNTIEDFAEKLRNHFNMVDSTIVEVGNQTDDWKTQVGYRLFGVDDDQAIDLSIAYLVGARAMLVKQLKSRNEVYHHIQISLNPGALFNQVGDAVCYIPAKIDAVK